MLDIILKSKSRKDLNISILKGREGLLELSSRNDLDIMINGLVGSSGLEPTLNAIQAGVTITPALEKIPGYKTMINNAKNTNPHKCLTSTKNIAEAVTLLGLSNNYWLTGNTIKVDGGESLTN